MKWTDLYFETQYLMMVIPCVLVLMVVIIAIIISFFKKVVDKICKRQSKNTKFKDDKWWI